jgi:hypothetical protein
MTQSFSDLTVEEIKQGAKRWELGIVDIFDHAGRGLGDGWRLS